MKTKSGRQTKAANEEETTALLTEVRACRLCVDVLPLGPRPILQIAPEARILIAGQAPGRKAHVSGVPFSDPSGDRLRNWLGVDAESFYDPHRFAILPMGFCYPGTGTDGDLPPRPECAAAWRRRLLAALGHIELTLVIGRYAADWHLENAASRSVTELVAAWRDNWPHVLTLPHPSPRNQRWFKANSWFEADVVPRLRERVAELTVSARSQS